MKPVQIRVANFYVGDNIAMDMREIATVVRDGDRLVVAMKGNSNPFVFSASNSNILEVYVAWAKYQESLE